MLAFDPEFTRTLSRLLRWRRDVRRFREEELPEALVQELIAEADLAPSVGLSQPWRFVRVDSPDRRMRMRENFRRANQAALGDQPADRAPSYAALKLEGLDRAPLLLAVFTDPDPEQGGGLGRRTMPEALHYSAVLAIHTLWLASRARGVGLGWVSILDPAELQRDLAVDPHWHFIALLCLGWPERETDTPELEDAGWQSRTDPASRVLRR